MMPPDPAALAAAALARYTEATTAYRVAAFRLPPIGASLDDVPALAAALSTALQERDAARDAMARLCAGIAAVITRLDQDADAYRGYIETGEDAYGVTDGDKVADDLRALLAAAEAGDE